MDAVEVIAGFSGLAACITAYATWLLFQVTKEVYRITDKSAKLQTLAAIESLINVGNTACLSSEETLWAAESVIPHGDEEPDVQHARERFLTFIFLNSKQVEFLAVRDGLIEQSYQASAAEGVLKRMLTKPLAREMVRTRGYHPEFVAYCETLFGTNSQVT